MPKQQTKLSRFFLVLGIVFLFIIIALVVQDRIAKISELKVLKSSATEIIPISGREVERHSNERGVVLGKPVYAELNIVYEPTGNHTKRDLFDEIKSLLLKNQWGSGTNIVPDFFQASRQYGYKNNFTQLVEVSIYQRDNKVSVRFINR